LKIKRIKFGKNAHPHFFVKFLLYSLEQYGDRGITTSGFCEAKNSEEYESGGR